MVSRMAMGWRVQGVIIRFGSRAGPGRIRNTDLRFEAT